MSDQYLMALDAGTGAGRCLIVDTEGKKAFSAYREWGYIEEPGGPMSFGRSFDPDYFWKCLAECVREAMGKAGIQPEQVVGVSSTSQREGAVFLDKDGREVYAGPNSDARAVQEGMMLAQRFGQQSYMVSGHYVNPIFVPARLLWHQNNKPDVYERIAHVQMINDWILFRMCGEYACEPTNASETAVYNLYSGEWEWPLIAEMGLPKDIFPPIRPGGYLLGKVTAQAAKDTGLCKGTPVVVGAADTQAGVLGAGAIKDGDIAAVAGTSTPVQMVLNEVILDQQGRLWSGAYIPEHTWVLESNAGGTGIVFRWMRDTFCGAEVAEAERTNQDAYDLMTAEAAQCPAGSMGVFAFIGTSIMDARDMMGGGSLGGILMDPYAAMAVPNSRPFILRAQLENMAYAIRANAEQIYEVADRRPMQLYACGGSTQSSLWVEILANVVKMPVVVPVVKEATAVGAAICAGLGAGVYGNLQEGMEALVKTESTVEPQPKLAEAYNGLYGLWMQIRAGLGEIKLPRPEMPQ